MAPRVAITVEGTREVHAGDGSGVYATLCGLDGDEAQVVEPAASWEKITCSQCADAWLAWRNYRPCDFVLRVRIKKGI